MTALEYCNTGVLRPKCQMQRLMRRGKHFYKNPFNQSNESNAASGRRVQTWLGKHSLKQPLINGWSLYSSFAVIDNLYFYNKFSDDNREAKYLKIITDKHPQMVY